MLEEDLNYYLEELSVRETLHQQLLKNFDEKLIIYFKKVVMKNWMKKKDLITY